MKESIWGWAIVVIGIVSIFFVYFFQNITNTDEHNYNLLKDVTEAAMLDAVDKSAYIQNELRINREKFVESFVRRFAESATLSRTYVIKIYDVSELPAKVSLEVSSAEKGNVTGSEILEFDISNRLDAILEVPY